MFKKIHARINQSNEQIELCKRDVRKILPALFGQFEDPVCTNVTNIKWIPGYLAKFDALAKRVDELAKRVDELESKNYSRKRRHK